MESILIVEDEKLIREGIKTIVKRSGVPIESILECNNGVSALEILENQKIDVLFTDIRMPKMDGIELVKRIKGIKHKPLIVAVSGYDDFTYARQLMREGVREYILKPVERNQIKEVLETLDKEIKAKEEQAEEQKNIGWQQLKYYLLNQDITYNEKALINKKYGEMYLGQPYRVVCSPPTEEKPITLKESIILQDVSGEVVYITHAEEDELKLKEEITYLGFSSSCRGLEELRKAYKEACYARQQAFYKNQRAVMFEGYVELKRPIITQAHVFDEQCMHQIVQRVGTYKISEALRTLKLMAVAVQEEAIRFETFANNIYLLIEEMTHTYQNVLQIESVDLERLNKILHYPCAEAYMEALIAWMIEINECITNKFDDYKNKQKIKLSLEFIKEKYNTDLSMAVVSNHISMNYSLFSHVFKQYTGKNFIVYLKDLRMEEAKRLLQHTDYKVNEISHRVGYENEKHFMKTFKTVFGVSPTEYRKNMFFKEGIEGLK